MTDCKCLGSGLVPVQLALTVATILRELELEPLAPDHALRVRSFPTMQPMDFRIRVLRRRAHSVAATAELP